ncbi:acireductone synthase [Vulcanococcus sp.]|uniref:acireductone synthase n=1 Tax=Vulcanococcus sp. TaxID=2856995 RepID=UPI003C11D970
MSITHILLDIEGTTCPVSFVAEVLFPYASSSLQRYLEEHQDEAEIKSLLQGVEMVWKEDVHPEAIALLDAQGQDSPIGIKATAQYLKQLIQRDIKLTELKDLQGRIWRSGYASGELIAPLFGDIPEALNRWHDAGLTLAGYSSGSVPAQKLLYGHCQAGDLRPLFQHWFDTKTGIKQAKESYLTIAQSMGTAPSDVLFISDALQELEAADAAGMKTLFSDREGNPARDAGRFARISDYSRLNPADGF